MSRVYGEPVEVQTREDGHRPARFVWRGRHYVVVSVAEHWVVNREWWREGDPGPAQPELEFWRVEASAGQGGQGGSQGSQGGGQGSQGGGQGSRGGGQGGQGGGQGQRGQGQPTGTYELRKDVAAGTWTLRRVAD